MPPYTTGLGRGSGSSHCVRIRPLDQVSSWQFAASKLHLAQCGSRQCALRESLLR